MQDEETLPVRKKRIEVIDAGRGAAMLFVFLSHFAEFYFGFHGKEKILEVVYNITMIASPSFMLISGTMLGYLYRSNPAGYSRIREKYIDRGMFLLLVAHLLILGIMLPYLHYVGHNYKILFITDTIGFSMILGSFLITRIQPLLRLLLSAGLYIISWVIVLELSEVRSHLSFWMEPLTGHLPHLWFDSFPLLPWFALFFAGTVLGEKISVYFHKNTPQRIEKLLIRLSLLMGGLFAFLFVLKWVLRKWGSDVDNGYLGALLFHAQKNPPGFSYLIFYGGAGIFMLYSLSIAIRKHIFSEAIDFLRLIGRNSLFVFIIQYFFLISLNVLVKPCWSLFWPLLFAAEVTYIVLLTKIWDSRGYNQLLTVLHPVVWKKVLMPGNRNKR